MLLDLGCADFHWGEFAIAYVVGAVYTYTVFIRFDVLTLQIH
jgi:hypothetical protein